MRRHIVRLLNHNKGSKSRNMEIRR